MLASEALLSKLRGTDRSTAEAIHRAANVITLTGYSVRSFAP